jgi:low affinity Fe/Cu permease
MTLLWLLSGPFFIHWSDTWQRFINTLSNIVAMLMLFLIQNMQDRDTATSQLKLDELLRSMHGAQNAIINLEELTEEDRVLSARMRRLRFIPPGRGRVAILFVGRNPWIRAMQRTVNPP